MSDRWSCNSLSSHNHSLTTSLNSLALSSQTVLHDNGIKVPFNEDELQFVSSVYIDVRYPPEAGLIPGGEPTTEHSKIAYQAVQKLNKWLKKE